MIASIDWLRSNWLLVLGGLFALAACYIGLEAELRNRRDKPLRRVLAIILIVCGTLGSSALNWVISNQQVAMIRHQTGLAIEAASKAHLKIFSDADEDAIAQAMEPYSDVRMAIQCMPGATESVCEPLYAGMHRSVHQLSLQTNTSLWGGGYDYKGPPPASHNIEVFADSKTPSPAADVIADALRSDGFDAEVQKLDGLMQGPDDPPAVLVRVYP